MPAPRYAVDPADPRAPSEAVWASLDAQQRRELILSLPSELPFAQPPEGDPHRLPKTRALEALSEYYRMLRRKVYISAELPVYYPEEPVFAPDLLVVLDTSDHERSSWVTSHEGKGLDFVLEFNVSGSYKKDFQDNVVRYARLGIAEYFAFDVSRTRLLGWRLAAGAASYETIVPQAGRWRSHVLELDLTLEGGRLRFLRGNAPLLDGQEWIARLSSMVDDASRRAEEETRRAEEETRRAEEETRRAEEEARRAEEEARRAERLAQRLRQLGIDPDAVE